MAEVTPRRMVVWEVSLGDVVDARAADYLHGGIVVHNLPVRHVCHIESDDQTGQGDDLIERAKAIGREAGLSRPMVKGCIRASEPVPHESIYRALQLASTSAAKEGA